jgi:hypothetical protein
VGLLKNIYIDKSIEVNNVGRVDDCPCDSSFLSESTSNSSSSLSVKSALENVPLSISTLLFPRPKHDRGRKFEFHVRHWLLTRFMELFCGSNASCLRGSEPFCRSRSALGESGSPHSMGINEVLLLLGKVGTAGHHRATRTIPTMRRKSGPCMGTMMSPNLVGQYLLFSFSIRRQLQSRRGVCCLLETDATLTFVPHD